MRSFLRNCRFPGDESHCSSAVSIALPRPVPTGWTYSRAAGAHDSHRIADLVQYSPIREITLRSSRVNNFVSYGVADDLGRGLKFQLTHNASPIRFHCPDADV